MSPPPLPPHPAPIKAGLERFGVYGTRWAAVALVGVILLWPSRERLTEGPLPVGPQAPLQEVLSGVPVLPVLARVAPGGLPSPDTARQRKAPCQTEMGEEAINGYCWLRLDVEPPCPSGRSWERGGKCYTFALRVVPTPTSGDMRTGNVAGEP